MAPDDSEADVPVAECHSCPDRDDGRLLRCIRSYMASTRDHLESSVPRTLRDLDEPVVDAEYDNHEL